MMGIENNTQQQGATRRVEASRLGYRKRYLCEVGGGCNVFREMNPLSGIENDT